MRYLSVLVLLALLLSACERPPGSGSIDGIDLGMKLELHLEGLGLETDQAISPGAKVYSGNAEDHDGLEENLRIAIVPIVAGTLAVAVNDAGILRHARLWGAPAFDVDAEAAWENFWRQFPYRGLRSVLPAPDSSRAPRPEVPDSIARDLYEHVRAMYDVNFLVRRTMAVTAAGETPEADWYLGLADRVDGLPSSLESIRDEIGEEAFGQYDRQISEFATGIRRLAAVAQEGDAARLSSEMSSLRRQACGGCHGIESAALGDQDLKDKGMALLPSHGVNRTEYRVGVDVWGVPGAMARSQVITNGVRGAMEYFGKVSPSKVSSSAVSSDAASPGAASPDAASPDSGS